MVSPRTRRLRPSRPPAGPGPLANRSAAAVVEVAQCRLEVNNVSARLHMVAPELAQWLSGQSAASLRQVAKDDQAAYLDKFAAARAAHSLWFALDADPLAAALESVYGAQAARGNLDALRAVVSRALTAS